MEDGAMRIHVQRWAKQFDEADHFPLYQMFCAQDKQCLQLDKLAIDLVEPKCF